ncbi:response regulator transcription factor [Verrucomicrobiaceae bacterium R5-34]|uniref:Response regulator transcription factor n=1 Tax=Oceaniferula flava TaxID=2800421 RepID=A0AAE2VE66_9BACT|nr:LytTR family DNA-binding domain-containing protein [Oceaniferula flavus]MBK1831280.1 response regulator transcription factor [Verrucomicrobiaceae bacterium R5-34]MBK1855449.1 response regulator transcription factor [Oceaniferula flavus]MBM1136755.1 response regulator transcription factor [Oceaniferula flavus]
MTILIIEDNEIEMENLKLLLAAFEGYEVIATAESIHQGIELANNMQPELIMLDLQLDCQNSLEHVHLLDYSPYIICSTLCTEHALQAFEVGASDYLTKPITHEKLCRALERLPQGQGEPQHRARKMALPLHNGTKTQMVPIDHITLVTADRDYTIVRDISDSEFISTRRMHEWGKLLPSPLFVTLDRSTIVNLDQIDHYTRLGPDRTATINFKNEHQHRIGSTARRRLKASIEN